MRYQYPGLDYDDDHLAALLGTDGEVESLVCVPAVAVLTEHLRPGWDVPHCHQGHDGAQHGVGGEESVLGVPPEAVVSLSEPVLLGLSLK